MPSKLFAALFSTSIVLSVGCRSGEGGATNASQATAQPTAAVAVANTAPATPAPNAPAVGNNNPNADACRLLTSEEIQAVQGEGLKETKGSDASTDSFSVSQCFYETTSFTNSVSLTLTRKRADAKGESPREFFKKNFGGEKEREREKEAREKKSGTRVEEEEEGLPPARVRGVGDEAYWVGNDKVGALYVLRGDKFIRVSVGGGDKQDRKIEKAKALAQSALKRV